MSGDRARIKAALTTVEGIKAAYDAEPDQKVPGTAWPVLREFSRDGTLCGPYTRSYDVFAVLPNTNGRQAADAADALIGPLVAALEPLGEWTQPAEVVQIAFDNNSTVPGLRVRITPDPE